MKYYLIFVATMFILPFCCSRDKVQQTISSNGPILVSSPQNPLASGLRERVFIEGLIGIDDTSTGCWYFQTSEGHLFEPLFCVRDDLNLRQGMRLMLYGYVEPDAPQTCALGPVFYAEQTQILELDD